MKKVISGVLIMLFAVPIWVAAKSGWGAVPRASCQWRDEDFCSDYGPFYWASLALLILALVAALWAINRRPQR